MFKNISLILNNNSHCKHFMHYLRSKGGLAIIVYTLVMLIEIFKFHCKQRISRKVFIFGLFTQTCMDYKKTRLAIKWLPVQLPGSSSPS